MYEVEAGAGRGGDLQGCSDGFDFRRRRARSGPIESGLTAVRLGMPGPALSLGGVLGVQRQQQAELGARLRGVEQTEFVEVRILG